MPLTTGTCIRFNGNGEAGQNGDSNRDLHIDIRLERDHRSPLKT